MSLDPESIGLEYAHWTRNIFWGIPQNTALQMPIIQICSEDDSQEVKKLSSIWLNSV